MQILSQIGGEDFNIKIYKKNSSVIVNFAMQLWQMG